MTGAAAGDGWEAANHEHLVVALDAVRCRLRRDGPPEAEAERAVQEAAARVPGEPALTQVVRGFGLSPFERDVLLLAAGPELVAEVAAEVAQAGGSGLPSFSLALAVLPGAHWSALSPSAPLRRWRLVRLLDDSSPTRSPLVADERVLHHLVGVPGLDEQVEALSRPLPPARTCSDLDGAVDRLVTAWSAGPVVRLAPAVEARTVAGLAAARLGLEAAELSAADLPGDAVERVRLARLLERESVLGGRCWVLDLEGVPPGDAAAVVRTVREVRAPVVLLGGPGSAGLPLVDVPAVSAATRRGALSAAAAEHGVEVADDELDVAASTFALSPEEAHAAVVDAAAGVPLVAACRRRARAQLPPGARRVEPRRRWSDLVLPAECVAVLRALVAQVRHRVRVVDVWGFGRAQRSAGGVTALFTGPSGTGKTLAAEVVAGELGLDLVQVDLAHVVSKYIGETEKNLSDVFDAAERGGAVLLFDEADALFGKRTEVRDSHDRYANLEVGYLLQRMESYRGLAVLTTNSRSALDQAFLRRLRFVVAFPYPGPALRQQLWARAFPAEVPLDDVDPAALARVDLPGGGIASAALNAAYLAAADGGAVTAQHVRTATQWELAKTGTPRVLG